MILIWNLILFLSWEEKQEKYYMKNLHFDLKLANNYTNNSQKIRILSENWVLQNVFCPKCGNKALSEYNNNKRKPLGSHARRSGWIGCYLIICPKMPKFIL